MKRCSKCGLEKDESEFHKNNARRDGLSGTCKTCAKVRTAEWVKNHPERAKENVKRWQKDNIKRMRELNRKWEKNNPERKKELAKQSRARMKPHLRRDKDKRNANERVRHEERKQQDPLYVLRRVLRRLITASITRRVLRKPANTEVIVGCTFQELLTHLGPKPCDDAHIDHIVPCAQGRTEEEVIKLQHYTNLRWLSAEENLKKSDNKTPEGEEMCRKLLDREWID